MFRRISSSVRWRAEKQSHDGVDGIVEHPEESPASRPLESKRSKSNNSLFRNRSSKDSQPRPSLWKRGDKPLTLFRSRRRRRDKKQSTSIRSLGDLTPVSRARSEQSLPKEKESQPTQKQTSSRSLFGFSSRSRSRKKVVHNHASFTGLVDERKGTSQEEPVSTTDTTKSPTKLEVPHPDMCADNVSLLTAEHSIGHEVPVREEPTNQPEMVDPVGTATSAAATTKAKPVVPHPPKLFNRKTSLRTIPLAKGTYKKKSRTPRPLTRASVAMRNGAMLVACCVTIGGLHQWSGNIRHDLEKVTNTILLMARTLLQALGFLAAMVCTEQAYKEYKEYVRLHPPPICVRKALTPHCRGLVGRVHKILLELAEIIQRAEEELEEPLDVEAIQALKQAAVEVAYKSQYYDMQTEEIIYLSSVAQTILDETLFEAAEKYYAPEEGKFPIIYATALCYVAQDADFITTNNDHWIPLPPDDFSGLATFESPRDKEQTEETLHVETAEDVAVVSKDESQPVEHEPIVVNRQEMIHVELEYIIHKAEEDELEDEIEEDAVDALKKGAMEVAYKKQYYDVLNDKMIYLRPVAKTILDYSLIEAAETHYYDEEDEFPMEYSVALRSIAGEMMMEDELDYDYVEKLATDLVDASPAVEPVVDSPAEDASVSGEDMAPPAGVNRANMIEEELTRIIRQAEEMELEDEIEEDAVDALKKGAMEVAYKKQYYDVLNDKMIYLRPVAKTILDYSLIEAAETHYYDEEDEFPMEYSVALRSIAGEMMMEDELDYDYVEKLATDLVDASPAVETVVDMPLETLAEPEPLELPKIMDNLLQKSSDEVDDDSDSSSSSSSSSSSATSKSGASSTGWSSGSSDSTNEPQDDWAPVGMSTLDFVPIVLHKTKPASELIPSESSNENQVEGKTSNHSDRAFDLQHQSTHSTGTTEGDEDAVDDDISVPELETTLDSIPFPL
eukprot:Nitzschia sp. Nitz4//scaffold138_size62050//18060//20930//NITZ4_006385-RA/size62050-processed-gene-0.59-mRNA-1//-1//CDS//3329535758//5448//frame0